MAGLEIAVQPTVIDWVLQHIRNERIDHNLIDRLQSWKNGTKKPTFNQLEEASKKTHIPFGYFLLKKPPVEKISMVNYRTIDSSSFHDPSRNLIDTIDQMEMIQDWMNEYLQEEGADPLEFVGSVKKPYDVSEISSRIRRAVNVDTACDSVVSTPQDAFRWWRHKLTRLGILVFLSGTVGSNTHRKLDLQEFRGFALIDDYAPLIFINSADTYTGRLFSLIHENVHIWLGDNSLFNRLDWQDGALRETETICNAVAAELLVPEREFLHLWDTSIDLYTCMEDLAKTFHCSKFVIARRALDLDAITKAAYKELTYRFYEEFLQLKREGKTKKSGGDYYATQRYRLDSRFVEALNASVNTGRTQSTEAYRLTGMNRNTFVKLLSKMGDGVW